jgi:hypothetical protein
MSEIRRRVEAHRNDALVLLEEVTRTARLYEGFRLAGAVGHLARVQVLLAEELDGLPGVSKQEAARSQSGGPPSTDLEETPADGLRGVKRKPGPGHSD